MNQPHAADRAAESATSGNMPFGAPLQPFNSLRQNAARAMGLKFWRLTERERHRHLHFDAEGRLVTVTYPGHWRDVCAVIYLCSILPNVVHRACAFPDNAHRIVREIVAFEKLKYNTARAARICCLFVRLLNQAAGKSVVSS